MKLGAAILVVSIATGSAYSHEMGEGAWVNTLNLKDPVTKDWCCNEKDCAPVPVGGIKENAINFLVVETGEYIAKERIIWKAPDGRWWRCRNLGSYETGKTRCLIGPPRGM